MLEAGQKARGVVHRGVNARGRGAWTQWLSGGPPFLAAPLVNACMQLHACMIARIIVVTYFRSARAAFCNNGSFEI